MKTKLIALAAFTALNLAVNPVMAQRPNGEDAQARRAEMVQRQAEKMAKDFDLKKDVKDKFIETYKAYQKELRGDRTRGQRPDAQKGEKKLTNEEAQKQIEEYFTQQKEQIAQMERRLKVSKKYYEEFQQMLTPQQLLKIFRQPNMRDGNMQRGGGYGGPRPGGGQRQGGFGGPQGGFNGSDNNDF